MTRSCILEVSEESGVPVEDLTVMADIYQGPYGLPDEPPYNETVTLSPHVKQESASERLWSSWTWRRHREARR